MKTTIAKEFKWEMSHRLPYHNGPCRNIHGHTYKMRIEISGEPDKQGMLIDYFTITKIVEPLLEKLDHCFVCDDKDIDLIEFLKKSIDQYSQIFKFIKDNPEGIFNNVVRANPPWDEFLIDLANEKHNF
jgi:6-pyruvoyl tetrahydropterin synthase/QueD family protein